MRDRFPMALVGALLLVGVLGYAVLGGARRGAFADVLSTYRSEPDGARALYLLLESGGQGVSRAQQSFEAIDPQLNLVLLGVRFDVEHAARHTFGADAGVDEPLWTEDEDAEDIHRRGTNALRAPALSVEEAEKLVEHVRAGATVIYVPWSFKGNALLRAADVSLERVDATFGIRTLVPAQPSPYTAGVEHVEARVRAFLELPAGGVPLLIDDATSAPVAALVPLGQGRLVVISSPELAMNSALGRADNAQLWRSLIHALSRDGRVAFDEYHHGFTRDRSVAEFARRYGLQFAVGQLLLGVALWALSLRRLGRPRYAAQAARVGSTDALFAASRLYREGRHHSHAAGAIAKELAAEMAQRAGLSPRASPTDVSAALQLRGRADLSQVLLEVLRSSVTAGSEHAVQQVARQAALARRSLHHAAPRRAKP